MVGGCRRSVFLILVLLGVVMAAGVRRCNGEDGGGEMEPAVVVGAPMVPTEKSSLYSALQSFVGQWWNGSLLYPDPCGWTPIQGVSCDLFDGFWYVTELNIGPIHDNSLACAPNVGFSSHVFELNHLKSLSFYNCFISPISIPTGNWTALSGSLESLELRSNPGLIGPIPAAISDLRKLESLVLVGNGLTGELPVNIGASLPHLKRLVLAGNRFTGKIPDSFGFLRELLILDLSRNSLSGTLPPALGGLVSLLKLDLSKNRLAGRIPASFGNLRNLTLLDLSDNRFSGGLTRSLEEMSSLEELILSNNPTLGGSLADVNWERLQGGLTVLDLSNTSLRGEVPDSISELTKLRFLGLSENELSGSLSPKLEELPDVGALYVNGNNLSGELRFSREFYGRMGRRFGAWNNSNLCVTETRNGPFGVKTCDRENAR